MSLRTVIVVGEINSDVGTPSDAGIIDCELWPKGMAGLDATTPTLISYKLSSKTRGYIGANGVQSLALTPTNSLSYSNAYWHVQLYSSSPYFTRQELWQFETTDNTITVSSITVLTNTPVI